MRIAITGGMGFIGTEVASLLTGTDELIVVDFWQKLLREYEIARYPILDRIYGNLTRAECVMEPDEFIEHIKSYAPDVIVHLGAVVDTMDLASDDMIDRNVKYVQQLVDAANNSRSAEYIPGIVFASSAATYGSDFTKPNNPYGLTKVFGERIVRGTRGQFSCLRFFNVFGNMEHHKGQMASVPFKLAQAYKNGDRFDMHSLDSSRDFVSVRSVAQAVIQQARLMASSAEDGVQHRSTFDVGTGQSTTFADVDNFIMQATGNVISVIREVPIPPEIVGRYQNFTCAGIGQVPFISGDGVTTREAIEEQYGKH